MTFFAQTNMTQSLVGTLVAATILLTCATANAQQDSKGQALEVGDWIEFDFLGEKTQAEIIEFTRNGWPTVEVEFMDRKSKQFMPGRQVTLVESKKKKRSDSKRRSNSKKKAADDDFAELGTEMPADMTIDPANAEVRVWVDSSGKHKLKARLTEIKDGKAKLEKGDGRKVSLPFAKLSKQDQQYLLDLARTASEEEDPFAGGEFDDEENPFAGGESVRSNSSRSSKAKPDRVANTNSRSNKARSVKRFSPRLTNSIMLNATESIVEPDPAVDPAVATSRITHFATELTKHKFHNDYQPCISLNRRTMGVCVSNPFDDESEIVTVDLKTGDSSQPVLIDTKEAVLLAISDDGTKAVTYDEPRRSDQSVWNFWDLSDGQATLTSTWEAPRFSRSRLSHRSNKPESAFFVSQNRLLTIGRRVVLWDVETANAIYSVDDGLPASLAALSPGRNQIAINTDDSIFIVDTQDGAILGSIGIANFTVNRMAFSQSGQLLAGMNERTGEVCVWDFESRELVRQFAAPPSRGRSSITLKWCGDRYLLVDDEHLMDVELRASVWQYDVRGGTLIDSQDGRFWLVSDSKITPVELPHKNLDNKTAMLDPEELLVLKPGAEVTITIETDFAPSKEEEIRNGLAKMLEELGVSVTKFASLQLVASVKKLDKETFEVSSFFGGLDVDHFGRPTKKETISFTPRLATLELVRESEKLWSRSAKYGPGHVIHTKGGETTQQAADRMCKPNADFFMKTQFPQYIAVLPSGQPLGESEITAAGVR